MSPKIDFTKYEDIVKKVVAEKGVSDVNFFFKDGIKEGLGFLGDIHRFAVKGFKEGIPVEIHMIGKVISDSEVKRKVMPMNTFAQREFYAYDVILRELHKAAKPFGSGVSVNHPLCYRASADEYSEIILMEDLTSKGYEQCRLGKILDLDHTRLLFEQMARYHALSFIYKQKFPEKYREMSAGLTDITYTKLKTIDVTVKEALNFAKIYARCDGIDDVLKALQRHDIIERNRYLLDGKNDNYSVICHGDLWTNNLMFSYKEDKPTSVMLLDWQCIRYSPPVTDLYYSLFISVGEELREKTFHKLLDMYYNYLQTNIRALGGDPDVLYPENIFREHIAKYSYTAFSSALIMLTIFYGSGMPSEEEMEDAFEKHGTVLAGDKPTEGYVTQMTRTIKDIKENNLYSSW